MLNRTPSVSIKLTSPPINRWRVSPIQLFNFYLKYWFKSAVVFCVIKVKILLQQCAFNSPATGSYSAANLHVNGRSPLLSLREGMGRVVAMKCLIFTTTARRTENPLLRGVAR